MADDHYYHHVLRSVVVIISWLMIISSSSVLLLTTKAQQVQLDITDSTNYTFVESAAVAKGAVCLDGSPPAYALIQGYGQGSNNWILFFEGGAWCDTVEACWNRSKTTLGSSYKRQNMTVDFSNGCLSGNQTFNPEFYNWNRAFLAYCDGASFMGDVEQVDPKTGLYYRGKRVFDAIMEELMEKGLKDADNAILSGASAGGLAVNLHCDNFRSLLPNVGRVKCISDSAFFIRAKDLPGAKMREKLFAGVIKLHGVANQLPEACTSQMSPELCFFAENIVGHIRTPLFLIDSSFDAWQIHINFLPSLADKDEWDACTTPKFYFRFCNEDQLQLMKEFRRTYLKTLQKLEYSLSRGIYVHTRYSHAFSFYKQGWRCSATDQNMLANKTIARVVGDWFFDRSPFQVIDTKKYTMPRSVCGNLTDPDFAYVFNKKCFSGLY